MSTVTRSRYADPGYARQYHDDRFGGRFGAYLERYEVDLLRGMVNGTAGALLDAGVGSGKLTAVLVDEGREVVAIDASEQMLMVARERAGGGTFVVANLETLAFRDRVFASSVSSRVLMHIPDWPAAVRELCRVTEHTVVVDLPPTFSAAGVDAVWKAHRRRADDPSYRTFRLSGVEREFERAGFVIVERKRSFLLPYRFHRWLDRPGVTRTLEMVFRWLGLTRLFGAPVTLKAVRHDQPL